MAQDAEIAGIRFYERYYFGQELRFALRAADAWLVRRQVVSVRLALREEF